MLYGPIGPHGPRSDIGEPVMTLINAVMDEVRRRIANGTLSSEEKLPSIRGMAAVMGVSPSTVVDAYERLSADGLISSRPGSGFFARVPTLPPAFTGANVEQDRVVDPLWVSRQSLDGGAGMLKPGCGWLPPDWLANEAIRRSIRALSRADGAILAEYGCARGLPELRSLLARQFNAEGLEVSRNQILLTSSGTQAFDLICRSFIKPGDTVLIDDPCYFNFQAALRVHQAKVVGIPYTSVGPDPAIFRELLTAHHPRLYVTNSAIHNPTGATMTAQTAHRLLTMAASHDLVIVEDDTFADLEPGPSPRLAVLDGLRKVVRIGGYSKTLSASIRCGYIVGREEWIEDLVDLQVATNFGGASPFAGRLVLTALSDGTYRRHIDGLRRRLVRARRDATSRLSALGIVPWLEPRGGFYLWCRLPEDSDAAEVAQAALREDVVLAPGNVFSHSQSASHFMRFNVAQSADPRVFDVLSRALNIDRMRPARSSMD